MENFINSYSSLLIPIALVAVFYFLLIRPQQKQQKKRKSMLTELKVGDRITTIGRIYGTVTKIKDDIVTIEVGAKKVELMIDRRGIDSINEIADAESML
ncbi:MAG: preprotein translocase subunit YajC [Clostridiales bacterium]|nr:preprotein translocase subunit YajC [Clostridiales bacterium]